MISPGLEQLTLAEPGKIDIGMCIVYGALAGVVLYSVTRQSVWIATGPALGVLVGSVYQLMNERQ